MMTCEINIEDQICEFIAEVFNLKCRFSSSSRYFDSGLLKNGNRVVFRVSDHHGHSPKSFSKVHMSGMAPDEYIISIVPYNGNEMSLEKFEDYCKINFPSNGFKYWKDEYFDELQEKIKACLE